MVESEHFNAGRLPFFTHLHLLHFHHIKQFETFPRNAFVNRQAHFYRLPMKLREGNVLSLSLVLCPFWGWVYLPLWVYPIRPTRTTKAGGTHPTVMLSCFVLQNKAVGENKC